MKAHNVKPLIKPTPTLSAMSKLKDCYIRQSQSWADSVINAQHVGVLRHKMYMTRSIECKINDIVLACNDIKTLVKGINRRTALSGRMKRGENRVVTAFGLGDEQCVASFLLN